MNKRLATVVMFVAGVAAVTGLFASPPTSASNVCPHVTPNGCVVSLTTTGPSPGLLTMSAERFLEFYNPDSVTHTVVFANGRCSLTVPPGDALRVCPNNFSYYVGSYAYTEDGTFPGTVVTTPLPRSVTLTARTHTIRRGTRLTLRGQVVRSNTGSAPPPPVVVLARHNTKQRFEPVATVRTRGSHQATYGWRLSVQPGVSTTYIATVTAQRLCYYPASRCAHPQGQLWTNAKSRPFGVQIRPAQAGLKPASAQATHRAARATTINVSTHNSRYVLSSRAAPRGVVIFKVHNPASQPHDFNIKGRTSKLLTTGQSTTLRVTFLRKGRYPYKDTFDHHASFGCRGVLRIK
jgi:Cupredoxin-like domain